MIPKSAFRTWLVDRVSEAQLSKRAGETLEDRAKRLGVQTDVLVEAEQLRFERIERVGRYPSAKTIISTPARHAYTRQISLYVPPEVAGPLETIAESRSLLLPDIARAVVHTLLLGPDNPVWRGEGWLLGGKIYRTGRDTQRKVTLTIGADIALAERAARLGATKTGLMRGAIADLIEGRLKKLIYVDIPSMWNDPKKYWTGDLVSSGNYEWLDKGR